MEPLKTFPWRQATSFFFTTWHFTLRVRTFTDSIWVDLHFIPPYSPYFNRIEEFFSMLKRNDRSDGRIAEGFSAR